MWAALPYIGLVLVLLTSVTSILKPYLDAKAGDSIGNLLKKPKRIGEIIQATTPASQVLFGLAISGFLVSLFSFYQSRQTAIENNLKQANELRELKKSLKESNKRIRDQQGTIAKINTKASDIFEKFSPYEIQYSIYLHITDIPSGEARAYLDEESQKLPSEATMYDTLLTIKSDKAIKSIRAPLILRGVTVLANNPTVTKLQLIPPKPDEFIQKVHLFLSSELSIRKFSDIKEIQVDTGQLTLISQQKNIAYRVEFRIRDQQFSAEHHFENIKYGLKLRQVKLYKQSHTKRR